MKDTKLITEKVDNHTFIWGPSGSGKTNELIRLCLENNQPNSIFFTIEETAVEIARRFTMEGIVLNMPKIKEIRNIYDIYDLINQGLYKHFYIDSLGVLPFKGNYNPFEAVITSLDDNECTGYFTRQSSLTTY